jgi:hypothetical protein
MRQRGINLLPHPSVHPLVPALSQRSSLAGCIPGGGLGGGGNGRGGRGRGFGGGEGSPPIARLDFDRK